MPSKLPITFFQRDAQTIAQELLGKILVRHSGQKTYRARIVETEAYIGPHDLACHASKGRTKRTEVMYQSGGHIYVYLIYGIHEMFNVVTGQEGCGEAVLVRAAESINSRSINLSGPGRFTKSLKIDRRLNGKRLDSKEIYFLDAPKPTKIKNTKRIGVEYAGKWANRKLRFYDANSKKVSTLKQRS